MSSTSSAHLVILAAALVAGVLNSLAGGGTLVSFPALVWAGLPSITANATSTVGIWPASLAGMWGYRRDLRGLDSRSYVLIAPSVLGGLGGAILLKMTPTRVFDRLVPLLIFSATCLFMAQEPVQRVLKQRGRSQADSRIRVAGALVFQFFVALYGGYFGAGMGILMLAALGILGYTDIHQMNGLKNLLAVFINGLAAVYFIVMHMVSWPEAALMAVGATIGGYGGAGVAKRIGPKWVRRIVVLVGFGMTLSLLLRR